MLKRSRRQVKGPFVEVTCATVRGDAAMSALFGHLKGASHAPPRAVGSEMCSRMDRSQSSRARTSVVRP